MLNEAVYKLVDCLADELTRAGTIIDRMDDSAFLRSSARSGSVGAQFRHNLDFVNSFLRDLPGGQVDFERRERDPFVETDRAYAKTKLEIAAARLRRLKFIALDADLLVRSEIDDGMIHASTVSRELEFLLSHTIHHHALIAEKLEAQGISTPRELGVAPSTLRYRKSERIDSMAARDRP
jgi:hypothetical protein